MSNSAVRAVVIGAGTIAHARHMPAVQALEGRIEVDGVVDREPERARAFAKTWVGRAGARH